MDKRVETGREFWRSVQLAGGATAIPRWTPGPAPGVAEHVATLDDDFAAAVRRLADELELPLHSAALAAHAKVLAALSSELSDDHPWARDALAASFAAWSEAIRAGLIAMIGNGTLRRETDPGRLALALLAAVQGGLLLAQAQRSTDALEAALDTVIAQIHDHATETARR